MSVDEETDRGTARAPDVQWRRLDQRLWVGRSGQRHLGTIELGSRYVYVDVEGVAHRGCRTLHEAQDVATGPIALVRSTAASPTTSPKQVVVQVALLVVAGMVLSGLIWLIGSVLFVR